MNIPEGSTLTFHIRGIDLVLNHSSMECGATATVSEPLTYVEILEDRTSIEAFANHGEASLSRCAVQHREGLSLECRGGPATAQSIELFDVRSAWPD